MGRLAATLGAHPLRATARFRSRVLAPAERQGEAIIAAAATRGLAPSAVFSALEDAEAGGLCSVLNRGESLLLHALAHPTWDSRLFEDLLGPSYGEAILDLLALGALSAAGPTAAPATAPSTGGDHPLRSLSRAAIEYGSRLTMLPANVLAWRLYAFNAVPLRGQQSFAVLSDYLRWLAGDSRAARELTAGIYRAEPTWLRARGDQPSRHLPFKMYLSPRPEDAALAFQLLAECLRGRQGWEAKIVGSVALLGRPDKVVIHFDTLESLRHAAEQLGPRVEALSGQGVPFTAPLAKSEVMSWGMDPLPREGLSQSWRQKLCLALAASLQAWAREGRAADVHSFLRQHLRTAAIDPDTWAPEW